MGKGRTFKIAKAFSVGNCSWRKKDFLKSDVNQWPGQIPTFPKESSAI